MPLVRSAGLSRVGAAGVTWTCRTTSAGWAGRSGHTSVIDAAGTIYVIGGSLGDTYYHDVWVSTDGGARAGPRPGVARGVVTPGERGATRGYYGGTKGPTGGTRGYSGY